MSGAMDAPSVPRDHTTAARRSFFLIPDHYVSATLMEPCSDLEGEHWWALQALVAVRHSLGNGPRPFG